MLYSHFERASLKIGDFEAKFDLEFEKPSASAQGGSGGNVKKLTIFENLYLPK